MTGICIVLAIFFIYYVYCLYVTKDIMDYANRVAQGEITVESRNPYATFCWNGENDYTYDIKRYFTYCGLTQGRIYVTCMQRVAVDDDGTIHESRDWFYIEIEKGDGKWKAVRCVGEP